MNSPIDLVEEIQMDPRESQPLRNFGYRKSVEPLEKKRNLSKHQGNFSMW